MPQSTVVCGKTVLYLIRRRIGELRASSESQARQPKPASRNVHPEVLWYKVVNTVQGPEDLAPSFYQPTMMADEKCPSRGRNAAIGPSAARLNILQR